MTSFLLNGLRQAPRSMAPDPTGTPTALDDAPSIPFDRIDGGGAFAMVAARVDSVAADRLRDAAADARVELGDILGAIGAVILARLTDARSLSVAMRNEAVEGTDWSVLNLDIDQSRTIVELARTLAVSPDETGLESPAAPRLGISVGAGPALADETFDLTIHFAIGDGALEVQARHRCEISRQRGVDIVDSVRQLAERLAYAPESEVRAAASFARPGILPDPEAVLATGDAALIHEAFLRQARLQPEATAVVDGEGRSFSYGELEIQTRAVARQLQLNGVVSGSRVAIIASRSASLVLAMLAAARLGATFIVLDSSYPEGRLAQLIEIAAADMLVSAGGDAHLTSLMMGLAEGRTTQVVDAAVALADPGEVPGLDAASADQPAYFLFTSGSTGTPKCVACAHRPLVNFVAWQSATFELDQSDRFSMLSGLSHDPLLRDIFTPLSIGAMLVIPRQDEIFQPGGLAKWFVAARPTVAHTTPAMGQLLTAAAKDGSIRGLRWIFWGGDLLRPALLAQVKRACPGVQSVNFYGSTETPQAAGWFRFDDDDTWRTVPVGRGAGGFQLLIVDRDRNLKGVGEVGEVAVRSNFLSLGYVEHGQIRPRGPAADIYYTGDRGYYLPSGDVQVLGRQDDQIKIRGYRVDLSEINAAMMAHPRVRSAIALPSDCGTKIRAFVVADGAEPGIVDSIAEFLRRRLPSYMAPTSIDRLEAMPLLPNGKIDRMALRARAPAVDTAPEPASRATGTAKARALAEKWNMVLGRRDVAPGSSFVSIGGDSLSYVQLYLATEEVLGAVPDGWHLMSLQDIAATATPAKRFFSDVDTSMIIRAVSIVLVVAGHFALLQYGGGATSALFLVSGFMIGGHQLWEVFNKKSAKPILKVLLNVTIPVALFSYALFFAKVLKGQEASWSLAFFYKNFFSYSPSEKQFFLWYIHCMMQMLAILYLSVLLVGKRRLEPDRKWAFLVTSFAIACVFRFAVPFLVFPDYPEATSNPDLVVNLLPTTHYATLILGAMVACAETSRQRITTMAAALAYAAATYFTLEVMSWFFILASAFALLFVRRLPVLKPFGRVIFMLSGGSLFIYLTHYHFRLALKAIGVPHWPLLHVACALVGGILVWIAWNRVQALSGRLKDSVLIPAKAAG